MSVVVAIAVAVPGTLTLAGREASAIKPLPRDVKLSAADAARVAAEARKSVNVEMPPGLELKLWASDAAHRRSRRPRIRRNRDALRDEHEPQQHAARHPRTSDVGADGPYAEDGANLVILHEGAGA